MSTIESVQYYSACPQCGAANVGNEKCDYCGASLIKSRINTTDFSYQKTSEEEKNYMEDSYLPQVNGKIFEKDDFLLFFCPIFGGIFLLVPTVIFIAFSSAGIMEIWVFAMLVLFWIIGAAGIAPLVNYFVKKKKCKSGRIIKGIVRGYDETMMTVNGKPVLMVRLLVDKDTEPKILCLNTGSTKKLYPLGKEITLQGYDNNFVLVQEKIG